MSTANKKAKMKMALRDNSKSSWREAGILTSLLDCGRLIRKATLWCEVGMHHDSVVEGSQCCRNIAFTRADHTGVVC